jgi:hypothetical protein
VRVVLGWILAVSACSEPQRVVLSRGTTTPRFLADASVADTVSYYGRTDVSDSFDATAILMEWAYLLAYARQQGRARFDDAAAIDAEARRSLEHYAGAKTSFAVRITITSELALGAQDPLVDLATWSFRLRDGRGRVARSAAIETISPQGRTEVEAVPTWGGAIAIERHTYGLKGAVVFDYRLERRAKWIALHAYAPGIDEDPLTFLWLLK